MYENEKEGTVPTTKWKRNKLGKGWVLGETMITGIGQGYIQTTPLQLCLMTAQLANGGYKIYPKITVNKDRETIEDIKSMIAKNSKNLKDLKKSLSITGEKQQRYINQKKYEALFKNSENIKIVLNAMFASTNEVGGTSFRSRIDDSKYQFAGKTGTAQVKRITAKQRELDLKIDQIPYKDRDHALYIAFGPYKNPRYALSIIVEHGGSGSTTAAPMAKKLFKMIIDRHDQRELASKEHLTT